MQETPPAGALIEVLGDGGAGALKFRIDGEKLLPHFGLQSTRKIGLAKDCAMSGNDGKPLEMRCLRKIQHQIYVIIRNTIRYLHF
jgi:hypothetical protein